MQPAIALYDWTGLIMALGLSLGMHCRPLSGDTATLPLADFLYSSAETHTLTPDGSSVSQWDNSGFVDLPLQQSTANHQPASNSGLIRFDGFNDVLEPVSNGEVPDFLQAIPLPDATGGASGEGFTCTGLSRLSDGRWVVGNDGRTDPGDSTYQSSVVILSSDFATLEAEYMAATYVSGAQSVQGVVVLPDDTIWFVIKQQRQLVHISSSGMLLGSLSLTYEPNGLAFDTLLSALIVSQDNGTTQWLNPDTGGLLQTKTLTNGTDHLFFDPDTGPEGALWITYGTNGNDGELAIFDIATGTKLLMSGNSDDVSVSGATSIEGLYFDPSAHMLTVMNDSYFHESISGGNNARQYSMLLPLGTSFAMFALCSALSVNGSETTSFLAMRDPITSDGAVALFIPSGSTGSLRLIAQEKTTASRTILNYTTDLSALSFLWLEMDFASATASLYVNDQLVGTQTLSGAIGCGFGPRYGPHVGALRENDGTIDRHANVDIGVAGVTRDVSKRSAVYAYAANAFNL
jgi:hypothetical protein